MRRCGIFEIDKENKTLIKEVKQAQLKYEDAKTVIKIIRDFWIKLAHNKAAELLESNFGWTKTYDTLIDRLSKNTKT